MRKLIAYSLCGKKPLYWLGLLNNIRVKPYVLPDWEIKVYIESDHFLIPILEDMGVSYEEVDNTYGGTFCAGWRFYAFAEDVDYVLVRDADSVLGMKDAYCVDEWLKSGKTLHSIVEFPTAMPLSAGCMGIKGRLYPNIRDMYNGYVVANGTNYSIDEMFLRDYVYYKYKDDMLKHGYYGGGEPILADSRFQYTGFKYPLKWDDVFRWKEFDPEQV